MKNDKISKMGRSIRAARRATNLAGAAYARALFDGHQILGPHASALFLRYKKCEAAEMRLVARATALCASLRLDKREALVCMGGAK